MHCCTCFMLYPLTLLLLACTVIGYLPYNCGDRLRILSITVPGVDPRVWYCSGIVLVVGFDSAINLTSTWQESSLSDYGNRCANYYYQLLNVPYWLADTSALYFPNSTCQCQWLGDDIGNLVASTDASHSATFIDFFDGFRVPIQAQDWGVFTCPEGASNLTFAGPPGQGECSSLSITLAGPLIAFGSNIGGGCGPFYGTNYNAEYGLIIDYRECYCYDDLKGLKYEFNLTGVDSMVDLYDFRPTTSLTISSTTTS